MSDVFPQPRRNPKLVITLEDLEPAPANTPGVQTPAPAPPAAELPPLPPLHAPAQQAGPQTASEQSPICAPRDVLEGHFGPEHGLLLPVPGFDTDSVLPEDRDGTDVRTTYCTAIELLAGASNRRVLRVSDIRARVGLTDARLTRACSKYDKGGGWVGDPVSMLALNAGSKLLAARRRRGRLLVGQVRYPWIGAVYAQNKSGWSGSEMLRVIVKSEGQPVRLDLTFPKDVDATVLATQLIRRAARFRLACEPGLEDEERTRLSELAEIAPLRWQPGSRQMAGQKFPSHWPAAERSARFGLGMSP